LHAVGHQPPANPDSAALWQRPRGAQRFRRLPLQAIDVLRSRIAVHAGLERSFARLLVAGAGSDRLAARHGARWLADTSAIRLAVRSRSPATARRKDVRSRALRQRLGNSVPRSDDGTSLFSDLYRQESRAAGAPEHRERTRAGR